MKIRVIIFAVAIAFMASPAMSARAAVIFDGSFITAGIAGAPIADTANRKQQAQSFTTGGSAGSLTATFEFQRLGSPVDLVEMRVYSDTGGSGPNVAVAGWSVATIDGSATDTVNFDTEVMIITGPAIPAATRHWLVWNRQGAPSGGNHNIIHRANGIDGDLVAGEEQWRFIDSTSTWTLTTPNDLHLIIDDTPAAAADAITVPTDLDTITFLPFFIGGTCDSATQNQLEVEITEVGAPLNTVDRQFVTCEIDDTWDAGTMGAAAWNADFELELFDIVEGTFGTRNLPALDTITVTVDVAGNPSLPPPVIDPAATDDDFGFLGNLIRDALIFLFIPAAESLSRFSDLFEQIGDKPPIGFITATVAAFENLEVGTPVETLEGTATLSAYFDPIRGAISTFLFLLLALWFINRVARITI